MRRKMEARATVWGSAMKARTIQGVNSSYRAMLTAATHPGRSARDRRMKPFIRRWSPEAQL